MTRTPPSIETSITGTRVTGTRAAIVRAVDDKRAMIRAMLSGADDRARAQRDALLAFSVRVASAGILYLSQIVLARWMGAFEYGIYVVVWTSVLVLGGLSNLGLAVGMIRMLPEYRETGARNLEAGLLFSGRWFAVATSTVVALLGLLGLKWFGYRLNTPYLMPAYLALVCLPIFTLTDVQDGIGRACGWMGIALVPPYVVRPLLVLLTMAVAHGLGWPMRAETAAGAAIVATWLSGLAQWIALERQLRFERQSFKPVVRRAYAPRLWATTAVPLFLINIAELCLQNADVLIISAYLTPVDAAMYFAAAKTMSLVLFVHYAVGSAVANQFSKLNARGDQAALRTFVHDAVRWTFWPSLAAAVGILVLGYPLLWLFSPAFTAAYPVMFILVCGFLVRASTGPAEYLLNMLGEQKACATILILTALSNIALNLWLVPRYGIMGAAIATATALSGAAVAFALVARRRLGLEISIFSLAKRRPASPVSP
jgi:O-antigen/teichoic acid export membrane protein